MSTEATGVAAGVKQGIDRFVSQIPDGPAAARFKSLAIEYLRNGDTAVLAQARKEAEKLDSDNGAMPMFRELNLPDVWDDHDRRTVKLIETTRMFAPAIRAGIGAMLQRDRPEADTVTSFGAALAAMGIATGTFDAVVVGCDEELLDPERPNAVTRHLMSLSTQRLSAMSLDAAEASTLARLFIRSVPDRAEALIRAMSINEFNVWRICSVVVHEGGLPMIELAAELFARLDPDNYFKLTIAAQLAEWEPARFQPIALEVAKQRLHYDPDAVRWLVKTLGVEGAIDPLSEYFNTEPEYDDQRVETLKYLADQYGASLKPVLQVALKSTNQALHLAALRRLVDLKDPEVEGPVAAALEAGLSGPPRTAAKFAELAGRSGITDFRERLWKFMEHKSKLLRDAAAEGLAAGDPGALERAAGLLSEKSKDVRSAAIHLLGTIRSAESLDCLLNWMPREKDPEVRTTLTSELREAGVDMAAILAGLGPVSVDELRQRAAAVKQMPSNWIAELELIGGDPTGAKGPLLSDGSPLGVELARYLLRQQSRQSDPIPDPDAAALYALIDRRTSGDFAYKLLTAYLDSGRGKPDAWALIAAGVLGDNRVVTTLASQVRKWADKGDQKLGTWGVEALSLNGSDAAFMAVDSIARKFRDSTRRKHTVVGEAAQEAIEKAAKRMGISLDELGDRIVPAFGFEPGRPRLIEAGPRTIEAVIGLDFKLAMKDVKTGKRVVSIPKAASPETQIEFKGLGKLLQDVAKAQSSRLEGLMVRQHRWKGNRWRELFLQHPLLFPFAVQLVWATYDDAGNPTTLFRALPDHSLTDHEDNCIDPPADDADVGIVHPLDLTADQIESWRTHLSDYEIEPMFEQMHRRVVSVPDDVRDAESYDRVKGATLNAFSFRGRAERAGWTRGSSGDGGMIYGYRKRFPAMDVDAFVTLSGLPAWADPTATVTIEKILFVPPDSKDTEGNPRRMKLGSVPKMAYSEAVGDMLRISGMTDGVVPD